MFTRHGIRVYYQHEYMHCYWALFRMKDQVHKIMSENVKSYDNFLLHDFALSKKFKVVQKAVLWSASLASVKRNIAN